MRLIYLVWLLAITQMEIACNRPTPNSDTAIERKKAGNAIEENIYRSVDSMLAAFKRHHWENFAAYNHPNMMQMMGGKEHFIAFIQEQMKHIPDTAIKTIGAGNILQVIEADNDMQCVVEQHMHMQMEGIEISTITYLVGQSLDAGKNWTFFDASSSGLVTPKDIKPDLHPELNIPPQQKEVKQLQ